MTASIVVTNAVKAGLNKIGTQNDFAEAAQGNLRQLANTFEIATTSTDEIGDVVLMAALPGNARVTSIMLASDDLDSSTGLTLNVGIWKDASAATSSNVVTATAVAATAYASAVVWQAAAAFTEMAWEARNIDKLGQTIALDGAEAEHSAVRYIGIQAAAAGTTPVAGTVSVIINYLVP